MMLSEAMVKKKCKHSFVITTGLQPIDLSINNAVKDRLRNSFTAWYAEEVQKQLSEGLSIEVVKVDLRLSIYNERT